MASLLFVLNTANWTDIMRVALVVVLSVLAGAIAVMEAMARSRQGTE